MLYELFGLFVTENWRILLQLLPLFGRPFWGSVSAKNHGNLQDSPFRVITGRPSARLDEYLQDSLFSGYAGRLFGRNHVNLQDFPLKG